MPTPATTPESGLAPAPTAWTGWVMFGGIMMCIIGCFNALAGVVALVNDDYFLVSQNGLMVQVDYTAWGWTLLAYGVVVAATGFGVMAGQTWARVTGVILASINAVVNLAFLAAYPIWTTLTIALNVVVIYALIVHGREIRPTARFSPREGAYR